ncbi:MAG: porin [Gammaproteobacteria bacterium]|nr:MAG: porin [Gammaproteobacteria bacterium]
MKHANVSGNKNESLGRRARGLTRVGGAWGLSVSLAAAAALAQAQAPSASAPAPAPKPADSSFTWNGITLYGIVDIGVQYQTHGVPASDYFPAGTEAIILANSNGSVTAVTPSNLSQSRIGLSGKEPLVGDWSGVFRFETFFNPQSGNISDALKSQVLNNGRPAATQTTNVDSSIAGQYFAGAAYAGFSSPTYGTITFGRHVTPLADGVGKYDALGAANAFSLIGFSGTTAGGGVTEDRRLDQSLKYSAKLGAVHLGALYQFSGSSGTTNTAHQLQFGLEGGGGSIDLYYAKKYDAIATAPLTAAQVATLPALGYSPSNSLRATISDNTSYSVMGSFGLGKPTLFAGYEHIKFANPNTPLLPGSLTIGGYVLAVINAPAYNNEKILQVYWAGVKYAVTADLDLMAAYYGYDQNSFATGANAGCSGTQSGGCSGRESSFSLLADYRFAKRFDGYLGTFWTDVQDGLAPVGFLNHSTLTTTAGIRFRF